MTRSCQLLAQSAKLHMLSAAVRHHKGGTMLHTLLRTTAVAVAASLLAAGCGGSRPGRLSAGLPRAASVPPVTDAAGLPNIGDYPLSAPGFTSHNACPVDGGSPFLAIGMIRAMQRAGVKKTSFVVPDVAGAGVAAIGILGTVAGKDAL